MSAKEQTPQQPLIKALADNNAKCTSSRALTQSKLSFFTPKLPAQPKQPAGTQNTAEISVPAQGGPGTDSNATNFALGMSLDTSAPDKDNMTVAKDTLTQAEDPVKIPSDPEKPTTISQKKRGRPAKAKHEGIVAADSNTAHTTGTGKTAAQVDEDQVVGDADQPIEGTTPGAETKPGSAKKRATRSAKREPQGAATTAAPQQPAKLSLATLALQAGRKAAAVTSTQPASTPEGQAALPETVLAGANDGTQPMDIDMPTENNPLQVHEAKVKVHQNPTLENDTDGGNRESSAVQGLPQQSQHVVQPEQAATVLVNDVAALLGDTAIITQQASKPAGDKQIHSFFTKRTARGKPQATPPGGEQPALAEVTAEVAAGTEQQQPQQQQAEPGSDKLSPKKRGRPKKSTEDSGKTPKQAGKTPKQSKKLTGAATPKNQAVEPASVTVPVSDPALMDTDAVDVPAEPLDTAAKAPDSTPALQPPLATPVQQSTKADDDLQSSQPTTGFALRRSSRARQQTHTANDAKAGTDSEAGIMEEDWSPPAATKQSVKRGKGSTKPGGKSRSRSAKSKAATADNEVVLDNPATGTAFLQGLNSNQQTAAVPEVVEMLSDDAAPAQVTPMQIDLTSATNNDATHGVAANPDQQAGDVIAVTEKLPQHKPKGPTHAMFLSVPERKRLMQQQLADAKRQQEEEALQRQQQLEDEKQQQAAAAAQNVAASMQAEPSKVVAPSGPVNPFFQRRKPGQQTAGLGGQPPVRSAADRTLQPALAPIHVTQIDTTADASDSSLLLQTVDTDISLPPFRQPAMEVDEASSTSGLTFQLMQRVSVAQQAADVSAASLQQQATQQDRVHASGDAGLLYQLATYMAERDSCGSGCQVSDESISQQFSNLQQALQGVLDAQECALRNNPQASELSGPVQQNKGKGSNQEIRSDSKAITISDNDSDVEMNDVMVCDPPEQLVTPAVQSEGLAGGVDARLGSMLWAQRFQPTAISQLCGNAAPASKLKSWLEGWKDSIQTAAQPGVKATGVGIQPPTRKRSWLVSDDDDSQYWLDEESSRGSWLLSPGAGKQAGGTHTHPAANNGCVLSGPTGVGKTAAVYAVARKLGFSVMEINASTDRSGATLLRMFGEATQSRQLLQQGRGAAAGGKQLGGIGVQAGIGVTATADITPGQTGGKVSKRGSKQKAAGVGSSDEGSPLTARSRRRSRLPVIDEDIDDDNDSISTDGGTPAKKRKGRKAVTVKSKAAAVTTNKPQSRQQQLQLGKGNKHPPNMAGNGAGAGAGAELAGATEPQAAGRLALNKLSLILFEGADLLLEEDKGFAAALAALITDTKCPIVLSINTEQQPPGLQQLGLTRLHFEQPSQTDILRTACLACCAAGLQDTINLADIQALMDNVQPIRDVRQLLNQLQLHFASKAERANQSQISSKDRIHTNDAEDNSLCTSLFGAEQKVISAALGIPQKQQQQQQQFLPDTTTQAVQHPAQGFANQDQQHYRCLPATWQPDLPPLPYTVANSDSNTINMAQMQAEQSGQQMDIDSYQAVEQRRQQLASHEEACIAAKNQQLCAAWLTAAAQHLVDFFKPRSSIIARSVKSGCKQRGQGRGISKQTPEADAQVGIETVVKDEVMQPVSENLEDSDVDALPKAQLSDSDQPASASDDGHASPVRKLRRIVDTDSDQSAQRPPHRSRIDALEGSSIVQPAINAAAVADTAPAATATHKPDWPGGDIVRGSPSQMAVDTAEEQEKQNVEQCNTTFENVTGKLGTQLTAPQMHTPTQLSLDPNVPSAQNGVAAESGELETAPAGVAAAPAEQVLASPAAKSPARKGLQADQLADLIMPQLPPGAPYRYTFMQQTSATAASLATDNAGDTQRNIQSQQTALQQYLLQQHPCCSMAALAASYDLLSVIDIMSRAADPEPVSGRCIAQHQLSHSCRQTLLPGMNLALACTEAPRPFPRSRLKATYDAHELAHGVEEGSLAVDVCLQMQADLSPADVIDEILQQECSAGGISMQGSVARLAASTICSMLKDSEVLPKYLRGCSQEPTVVVPTPGHVAWLANSGPKRQALIVANDAILYSNLLACVQGHHSAAVDRVAALACICRLESQRVRLAQRSLAGRALRVAQTHHALATSCPSLPDTLYPQLIDISTFGRIVSST